MQMDDPVPRFTFQRETVDETYAGTEYMHQLQFDELASNKDILHDIDLERMRAAEKVGLLVVFTIRSTVDDLVVGYTTFVIAEPWHFKGSLQASADAIYINPHYRGLGLGKMLITGAHEELAHMGATVVRQSQKLNDNPHMADLLREIGYEPIETVWQMRLTDKGA